MSVAEHPNAGRPMLSHGQLQALDKFRLSSDDVRDGFRAKLDDVLQGRQDESDLLPPKSRLLNAENGPVTPRFRAQAHERRASAFISVETGCQNMILFGVTSFDLQASLMSILEADRQECMHPGPTQQANGRWLHRVLAEYVAVVLQCAKSPDDFSHALEQIDLVLRQTRPILNENTPSMTDHIALLQGQSPRLSA